MALDTAVLGQPRFRIASYWYFVPYQQVLPHSLIGRYAVQVVGTLLRATHGSEVSDDSKHLFRSW